MTTRRTAVRMGLTTAAAAAAVLGLFQGVSSATTATYTATPATGPATNASFVITLAGTGFADAAGNSLVHSAATGVKFATTCGTNEAGTTGTNATLFAVVSATRMAITTPSLTISSGTSTAYKICVFDASTNLLGSAPYTVYNAPTISAAISPAAGPAFGGNTITVVGTHFDSKLTATVGGVALSNIKVTGTTSFTATVPAHAASATALDVIATTEGGPSAVVSNDHYTYDNAVSVSPAVVANGTVVDVKGIGFSSLNWTNAKIYMVDGAYDPTDSGTTGTPTGLKTNPAAGTCTNVLPVSDTELVCTAPNLTGHAYTVTVVSNGAVGANMTGPDLSSAGTPNPNYTQTVVSSGATVTFAAF